MIREAVEEDAAAIEVLLRKFHAESQFENVEIDQILLDNFIRKSISDPSIVCIVHDSPGLIDAIFAGYLSNYFFSRELALWDLAFYVDPARRGGIIAYELLRMAADLAKAKGARSVYVNVNSGIDVAKVSRFMTGLGLAAIGSNYRLDLTSFLPAAWARGLGAFQD